MHELRLLTRHGVLVVRKDATDAAGRLRLSGEHSVLVAAAGPGVPEVLDRGPEDDYLVVSHCGSVVSGRAWSVERTVACIAALADVVDRLHQAGWAHTAISGDHVVIDADGDVTLCGLGAAEPVTDEGRRTDLAAVVDLLGVMLGAAHPPHAAGWRRHDGGDLAARAQDLAARSDGHRLGEHLRRLDTPPDRRSFLPTRRLRRPVVVVCAGLAVGALGMVLARGVDPTSPTAPPPAKTSPSLVAAPPRSTVPTVPSTTSVPAPTVALDGRIATVNGRRIEIGEEGDVVLLGDWDCDGLATPAILRPGTGTVFLSNDWPDAGAVSIEPLATVEGLVDLAMSDAECPSLLGVDRSGTSRELT